MQLNPLLPNYMQEVLLYFTQDKIRLHYKDSLWHVESNRCC